MIHMTDVQLIAIIIATLSSGILIGATTGFFTAHKDKENGS